MRKIRTAAFLFAALLAAAGSAQAQKMKPGLWEHSTAIKGGGGEMAGAMAGMQEQMARMKPEERQMMEQMMAQRGMSMPAAGGGGPGTSIRLCITADQAARDEVPMGERQCKRTRMTRSGNTVRFAFTCEGEHATSGEGEVTFVSATEQRGNVKVTTTRAKGPPETMEVQTSAKWLGADCGSVQPRP